MQVIKQIQVSRWDEPFTNDIQSEAIAATESGKILLFPTLPFTLTPDEQRFLSPIYVDSKAKNISYNSVTDVLRSAKCSEEEYKNLKAMLQRFSTHATLLVKHLLAPYASALRMGRTSYRPIEISGRVSSYRKDDTRLHVDAFPATPNQGQRILRVFSNINPHGQERFWRVGESFMGVAKRFLPAVRKQLLGERTLLKTFHITKTYRTEYDHIMLQIHDRMKADLAYQKNAPQSDVRFAPGSSWIVQTDHVSHAAMAGQYVLEQTFYLPVNAMQNPEHSPLHILETLTGRTLT
ncbi:MAG: Kdo hydroxylase family protein [Gammaproteobacteria bacterium]|nr:Kdo hydroxylase family protein [Gammaproteobacteria bacterium]